MNPERLHYRNNRVEWLDFIKVMTLILVVVGHSTYYSVKTDFGGIDFTSQVASSCSVNSALSLLVVFIYYFHMPLFMALSGMALRISYKIEYSFRMFVRKKARRLLLPFFLVTLFLSVPLKFFSGYWDASENIYLDILLGQFGLLGNSHLWFVVSLFYISITYVYLSKKQIVNRRSYWVACVLAAYLGSKLQSSGIELFGIVGALKNILYFSLGFTCFDIINRKVVSWGHVFLNWILVFAIFVIVIMIVPPVVSLLFTVPFAIICCYTMIISCKKAMEYMPSLKYSKLYRGLKDNSYGIYLYSDPFNYVIIYVLMSILGNCVFTENHICLSVFAFRFILQLILALGVVALIKLIKCFGYRLSPLRH